MTYSLKLMIKHFYTRSENLINVMILNIEIPTYHWISLNILINVYQLLINNSIVICRYH